MLKKDPKAVTAAGPYGQTPLHYAAVRGQAAMAGMLLDHKADVNTKDTAGRTPLHAAAATGRVPRPGQAAGPAADLIGLLLQAGADVNARDQAGETPVDAARISDRAVVQLLRDRGGKSGQKLPPDPAVVARAAARERRPSRPASGGCTPAASGPSTPGTSN